MKSYSKYRYCQNNQQSGRDADKNTEYAIRTHISDDIRKNNLEKTELSLKIFP